MATKKPNSERHSFIKITEVGICDPEGKRSRFTIGFTGKRIVAPVDFPVMAFVVAALERTREVCGWSSAAAAKKDFAKARKYLDAMEKEVEVK